MNVVKLDTLIRNNFKLTLAKINDEYYNVLLVERHDRIGYYHYDQNFDEYDDAEIAFEEVSIEWDLV